MTYHDVDAKLWRGTRPKATTPAMRCADGRHLWPTPPLLIPGIFVITRICPACAANQRKKAVGDTFLEPTGMLR